MFQRLRLLSAAFGFLALASLAFVPSPAKPADEIRPPTDYRHWFHVNTMIIDKPSPLFDALGGMHNVYANPVAEAGLRAGGPFPDGAMFVTDLHDFTATNGEFTEGPRKGVAVMLKDAQKYRSTGGWGFQFWTGADASTPAVTDPAKQCFACHEPRKDNDYVFSTYIP